MTTQIFNKAIETLNNTSLSFANREVSVNGMIFRNTTTLGVTEYSVFYTKNANTIIGWRQYNKVFKDENAFNKYLLKQCKIQATK
jgi:hypothetical protein